MANLTISTLIIIATIVTPVVPLVVIYRLILPKIRTVPRSEFALIISSVFLSLVINGSLLVSFSHSILNALHSHLDTIHFDLIALLFNSEKDSWYFRPAFWLFSESEADKTNIWFLFLDLHIRTFIFV